MSGAAGLLSRPPITIALALTLACAACGEPAEVLVGKELLVLEGATLIDGTGAEPRENSVIVVDGDRILRVGSAGDFRFPDSARRRDVSGHFVLPGFIDMHVHAHPKARIETVEALLEFGVTTIRSPGAAQSAGVELRDQIAAGRVRGPRMITGAAFIDARVGRNRLSLSRSAWDLEGVGLPGEPRIGSPSPGCGVSGGVLISCWTRVDSTTRTPHLPRAHNSTVYVRDS